MEAECPLRVNSGPHLLPHGGPLSPRKRKSPSMGLMSEKCQKRKSRDADVTSVMCQEATYAIRPNQAFPLTLNRPCYRGSEHIAPERVTSIMRRKLAGTFDDIVRELFRSGV
jgi:hypothetical protein